MSKLVNPEGTEEEARTPAQSGTQIWLMCLLFILVPTVVILIIKYAFNI